MASWHKLRKRIHLFCFLAFFALPFFNIVRFDIPTAFLFCRLRALDQRVRHHLLRDDVSHVCGGRSFVVYGRVYCGYTCPQMIFSDASVAMETLLRKRVTKKFAQWPQPPVNACRKPLVCPAGEGIVLLAFVFICYFVEPRDLFRCIASFDIHHCWRDFRRGRHAGDVPGFQSWCATVSVRRSVLTVIFKGCWRWQHVARPLSRRDIRLHRVQEVRAGLPHGHRYP